MQMTQSNKGSLFYDLECIMTQDQYVQFCTAWKAGQWYIGNIIITKIKESQCSERCIGEFCIRKLMLIDTSH